MKIERQNGAVWIMLIKMMDLLVNACVAFTGFYFISKMMYGRWVQSHAVRSIAVGTVAGLLGMFLMFQAVEVTDTVRIDLRHLPLVLMAFFGRRFPLIVAGIIITSSRFLFGVSDAAIVAFIGSWVIIAGLYRLQRHYKGENLSKLFWMNVFALSAITVILIINIGFNEVFAETVFAVWFVSLPTGLLASFLLLDFDKLLGRYQNFKESATMDHLTGLRNRRSWEQSLKGVESLPEPVAMLALDIDHFKKVNDTYGHANGDLVLQQFARVLIDQTRSQDIVARIGGEEFTILLRGIKQDQAVQIAERIRASIEQSPFLLNGEQVIWITSSIGIAESAGPFLGEDLLEHADQALYEAKRTGRNRVVVVTNKVQAAAGAEESPHS